MGLCGPTTYLLWPTTKNRGSYCYDAEDWTQTQTTCSSKPMLLITRQKRFKHKTLHRRISGTAKGVPAKSLDREPECSRLHKETKSIPLTICNDLGRTQTKGKLTGKKDNPQIVFRKLVYHSGTSTIRCQWPADSILNRELTHHWPQVRVTCWVLNGRQHPLEENQHACSLLS